MSCTSESSQPGVTEQVDTSAFSSEANQPPVVHAARILPNPIQLNQTVLVEVHAHDRDGDPITYRYQWFVNGSLIQGKTGSTLTPSMLRRGDVLQAVVIPSDGKREGAAYRTNTVQVDNTPPEVRQVGLDPQAPRVGDLLRAVVEAIDLDQDQIQYSFRWMRNGETIQEGERATLDLSGCSRGDTIVVEVTPFDSVGRGKPMTSEPIAVLNSPPVIVSEPPTGLIKGRYEYTVVAKDPDGDRVIYMLENSPPGMTIHSVSGRIEWPIPSNAKGVYHVRVVAEDGQGGLAFQELDLSPISP